MKAKLDAYNTRLIDFKLHFDTNPINKILLFFEKKKKIGYMEVNKNDIKALMNESFEKNVSNNDACKGANEIIAATGNLSYKNAKKSADVFINNGETAFEKALDEAEFINRIASY